MILISLISVVIYIQEKPEQTMPFILSLIVCGCMYSNEIWAYYIAELVSNYCKRLMLHVIFHTVNHKVYLKDKCPCVMKQLTSAFANLIT